MLHRYSTHYKLVRSKSRISNQLFYYFGTSSMKAKDGRNGDGDKNGNDDRFVDNDEN